MSTNFTYREQRPQTKELDILILYVQDEKAGWLINFFGRRLWQGTYIMSDLNKVSESPKLEMILQNTIDDLPNQ